MAILQMAMVAHQHVQYKQIGHAWVVAQYQLHFAQLVIVFK